MLTRGLAQELAQENAAVTGLGILVTGPDGVVLGSSDPVRIGTFHEASVEVVSTGEAASHTPAQSALLRGVRPGVTLPIIVDGEIIGTVGISGSPTRVHRFGPLVRRHTEMMARQASLLQSAHLRDLAVRDLVQDIANYDEQRVDPELMLSRARELGYDLRVPRAAVVVELKRSSTEPPSPAVLAPQSALQRDLREKFPDVQTIVTNLNSGLFVVLPHLIGTGPGRDDEQFLIEQCVALLTELKANRGMGGARVGVGERATSIVGLHETYWDAHAALRIGTRVRRPGDVYAISKLRSYQTLAGADLRLRAHTSRAVLGRLREDKDWSTLRRSLIAWCETGFSLAHGAAAVHVHRNTLVQRLAKIERLTCGDLTDRGYALRLYVACLVDELDR